MRSRGAKWLFPALACSLLLGARPASARPIPVAFRGLPASSSAAHRVERLRQAITLLQVRRKQLSYLYGEGSPRVRVVDLEMTRLFTRLVQLQAGQFRTSSAARPLVKPRPMSAVRFPGAFQA